MCDYVECRKGEYYIAGTRVPLECVVQEFRRGATTEAVRDALKLEQVCGAIAYYLDHQEDLDAHFRAVDQEYEKFRHAQTPSRADLLDRLERSRQDPPGSRS